MTHDDMQVRIAADTWPDEDLELRAEDTESGFRFTGYAAVFDVPSEPLPFRERIAPGAFSKSLSARRDIKMFLNHNWDVVLASRKAKTMTLREDDRGLYVQADLPDNEWGRPVRDAIRRGDISGMSFGFQPVAQDPAAPGPDEDRTVTEARLIEVSPVTSYPAYTATTASVRHLAELVHTEDAAVEAALSALTAKDGELTEEQRDLLHALIAVRTPKPLIAERLDHYRKRLEEIEAAD